MADRWTFPEVFELGRAVGLGLSAPDIARRLGRSLDAVQMKMIHLGKRMQNSRDGSVVEPIHILSEAKHVIDTCAAKRGQRREHVIERLCQIVGEEGELFLENLLDDK